MAKRGIAIRGGVLDQSIVVTLNQWAATQPLIKQLVYLIAERSVFLLPVVLGILWLWPGPTITQRRQAVVAGLLAAIIGLLLDEAIGRLLYRPRPFMALPIASLFAHAADTSFPSGHTIFGVALMGPLLWNRLRVGAWLVLWAIIIGIARIAAGVHYPSDVISSIILAAVISGTTVRVASYLTAHLRFLRRATADQGQGDAKYGNVTMRGIDT